jgi:hypothetical protein
VRCASSDVDGPPAAYTRQMLQILVAIFGLSLLVVVHGAIALVTLHDIVG